MSSPGVQQQETLLSFIEQRNGLFDMTALDHGKSEATTSQAGRVDVGGKRDRDGGGDGANARKKKKNRTSQGNSGQNEDNTGARKTYSFVMQEWDRNDFFGLLDKEGEQDIEKLGSIEIQKNKFARRFKKTMERSMDTCRFPTEGAIYVELWNRFSNFTEAVGPPSSSVVGQTPSPVVEGTDSFFLGLKKEAGKSQLPTDIGPDKQVDNIFSIKRCGTHRFGVVPMESKVPWNFPGGSVTCEDEDFGRLGRDVRLWDFQDAIEVDSLADGHDSQSGKILNPEAGEDEDEVEGKPQLHNGTNDQPIASDEGSAKPPGKKKGKYRIKNSAFPVRRLVSYMLSFKARYGICVRAIDTTL